MSQIQGQLQAQQTQNNQNNNSKQFDQNKINPQNDDRHQDENKNVNSIKDQNAQDKKEDSDSSDHLVKGPSMGDAEKEQNKQNIEQNDKQKKQNEEIIQKDREKQQQISQGELKNQQKYQLKIYKIQNYQKSNPQQGRDMIQKQNTHLNKNDQKRNDNQSSFMWGQQQKMQQTVYKSYQNLFINNNYKSQQILLDTKLLSQKIRQANHEQRQKKNQLLKSPKEKKINKPIVPQDVDIWSDIKSTMIQKSRLSQQTKSISTQVKSKPKPKPSQNNLVSIDSTQKINKKIANTSQVSKQEKKLILKIGRAPQKIEEPINHIQQMRKMIAEKVKKWRVQQKQIQLRRINKIQNQRSRIKMEQQKQIQEQRLRKQMQKKQRVKAISLKLKKKKKRQQVTTSPQQDKSLIKKIKKSNTERNIQKSEKKQRKKHNDQEQNKVSSPNVINKQSPQQQFSIFWNGKDIFQSEKQKLLRRKYFQQRIKQMPISVNQNKKLKIQIQVDKSSNPLKYQLLHKKGMNDLQIFHSTLKLPQNAKRLGNQYLRQIRIKNKSDDLKRYMSQQSVLNMPKNQRSWKPSPLMQSPIAKQQHPNVNVTKILKNYQQKKRQIMKEDDEYLNSIKR